MKDKKILFPLLLLAIFFVLIATTGFFQIAITKRNIEGLLRGEGETLFQSIAREVEMNMEYLTLIEKSPSLITPNFLNVMSYDEAIVDDLYNRFSKATGVEEAKASLDTMLVTDTTGKTLVRKGSLQVSRADLGILLRKEQHTVVRMPDDRDRSLFMGIRLADRILFFSLSPSELERLRKKYIMKALLENEAKRLNISQINVYDGSGRLYLGSERRPKHVFSILMPLNSPYFPGYSMEILLSNRLANDIFRRTSGNFIMLLFFLMLGGAGGISLIFQLERRHADKLSEMEKDMARRERLVSLGRLASGMAHEIRNPLNAISISIQRLKREFLPEHEKEEEYHRFLDIVRGELLRVNRIVEEFLLSAKSGLGMEPQSVHAIVEEVATMLRENAEAAGVVISNATDRKVVVECQKERMKQVFYNLIMNSIEAMAAGGALQISTEADNPRVRVLIRDAGPGIKKEDLPKVFEYYYTTKDRGMGLGLPLSYMIVKDHDGDLQVLSDEGKGTTFVISLPLRKGS
jgi:signal transduction histidine kinase